MESSVFFCHCLSLVQCPVISEHKSSTRLPMKETTVPLAWHLTSIVQLPRDDFQQNLERSGLRCFLSKEPASDWIVPKSHSVIGTWKVRYICVFAANVLFWLCMSITCSPLMVNLRQNSHYSWKKKKSHLANKNNTLWMYLCSLFNKGLKMQLG